MKRPLSYSSLRAHLHRLTHHAGLLGGGPVTFTAEELRSHFPGGQAQHPSLPVSYDADSYRLTGDDTLDPVQ
jgi:hypothetical protein